MPDSNITKNALANAMKTLMNKTPFSKISVGDICEMCQMNRKSFYYHFRDKYDLVNWIYYTEFISAVQSREYENGWGFLLDICRYFYENRRFYVNALQVRGQDSFRDYFMSILQPIVLTYLKEIVTEEEEDSRFFAIFFTDAFVASIERWLMEMPDLTPERFAGLLKASISGVARKIMQDMEEEESQI